MNRIVVKVDCVNKDGKTYTNLVEVENLLQASRFINAFVPKRGYSVKSWYLEENEVLI